MNHREVITRFSGKYGFLSNFYKSGFMHDGKHWKTSEHAFQAAKTHDPDEKERIRKAFKPSRAKKLGRQSTLRPDWEDVKVDVMRDVLRSKFAMPRLREKLVETWPALLVEGNDWGDDFWGVASRKGKNMLGNLLMEICAEIMGEAIETYVWPALKSWFEEVKGWMERCPGPAPHPSDRDEFGELIHDRGGWKNYAPNGAFLVNPHPKTLDEAMVFAKKASRGDRVLVIGRSTEAKRLTDIEYVDFGAHSCGQRFDLSFLVVVLQIDHLKNEVAQQWFASEFLTRVTDVEAKDGFRKAVDFAMERKATWAVVMPKGMTRG